MTVTIGTERERLHSDYEAHYDLLPDAVLVHVDGRWIYANPAACELFGASARTDLVGRSIFDVVPADMRGMVATRAASAAAGTRTAVIEQRLLGVDGRGFYAEVSGIPSTTPEGRPAVLVTMRDVTERLAAARRFRSTFEQSAVGMAHVGADGRWVRVNARLCTMLGYAREELEQLTFRDVMYPPDLALDELAVAKLIAGKCEHFASEKRYVRKDGSLIWANVTISIVHSADGGVDYFIAVAEDITTRKEAEEELLRRKRRFRQLVQRGADVILIVDPSGTIQFVSENVQRVLGFTPEEQIGRSGFEFVHPADTAKLAAALAEIVAGRPTVATARTKHKHDGWRELDLSGVNLLDDPSVEGIVINAHDVTERNRLSDEVAQLKRVESLGRVAASVAHELNNVLMSFQAAAMRAEKTGADEKFHATLKRALARGKSITSDILRFAQPAMVMQSRVRFDEWLADTVHDIEPLLGASHGVQLALDEGMGDVSIDRQQMTQVVTNLAINARDAMQHGGTIEIAGRHSDQAHGEVMVTVTDRGTGIDEGLLERIFDPLFTTKANGTGLGLSIVQQIVLRHHGRIVVESEKGSGTTFTITLPSA